MHIIHSIIAYLTKQQQEGAVSDPESLGVAVQMLRDLYNVQSTDGAIDLAELFTTQEEEEKKNVTDTPYDVNKGMVCNSGNIGIFFKNFSIQQQQQ